MHQVRTVVPPAAATSANAWLISSLLNPDSPTQYELDPTTVNLDPSSVNSVPEVFTKPVEAGGVTLGVGLGDVVVGVTEVTVGGAEEVPLMHWEYQSLYEWQTRPAAHATQRQNEARTQVKSGSLN